MLLLDHSAWWRLLADRVPKDHEEVVLDWIEEGKLATCLPFLLEAGFSALTAEDHRLIMGRLGRLPRFSMDGAVESAALDAQHELALRGHHRLAPADCVVAACAHMAGGGVLHYDRDYDLILEHTQLNFESIWLAEPGTL